MPSLTEAVRLKSMKRPGLLLSDDVAAENRYLRQRHRDSSRKRENLFVLDHLDMVAAVGDEAPDTVARCPRLVIISRLPRPAPDHIERNAESGQNPILARSRPGIDEALHLWSFCMRPTSPAISPSVSAL